MTPLPPPLPLLTRQPRCGAATWQASQRCSWVSAVPLPPRGGAGLRQGGNLSNREEETTETGTTQQQARGRPHV